MDAADMDMEADASEHAAVQSHLETGAQRHAQAGAPSNREDPADVLRVARDLLEKLERALGQREGSGGLTPTQREITPAAEQRTGYFNRPDMYIPMSNEIEQGINRLGSPYPGQPRRGNPWGEFHVNINRRARIIEPFEQLDPDSLVAPQ
ncbi:hypothetical protein AMATHDRAFT_7312 [Amanita thiersii Skay4041]|uniref:Uncharacterized protein n=1 Tax=Amanita thiersii Skay4041 TaxID=703135 RepID=A0A2A9NC33_9AGAR|nr:hypothetical protein AMATHDRAFT_7312 [Amanita thiersii Skay4041]